MAPSAGCVDIFGRRSRTSPAGEIDVTGGVERANDGRRVTDEANRVGREGPRMDANVLRGG